MNDIVATAWNDAFSLGLVVGLVLALAFSLVALRRGLRRERELARTDELTGIDNRRAFYELADREIRRAARYGKAFTVAYFDIDDFKLVNDRYGHEAGDACFASPRTPRGRPFAPATRSPGSAATHSRSCYAKRRLRPPKP